MPTEDQIVDLSNVDYIPDTVEITDEFEVIIAVPGGLPAYRGTIGRLRTALTPKADAAPEVTLAPVDNGAVGVALPLSATATSASSTIVKVEFFAGSTKISQDVASPYAAEYVPTAPGVVYITAKATDANGLTTISDAQRITVAGITTAINIRPNTTLQLTPDTLTLGQATTLSAVATDADGTVAQVEFFDGPTPLGSSVTAPYALVYTPTAVGPRFLSAKVTDNLGDTGLASATLTVNAAVVSAPSFYNTEQVYTTTPQDYIDKCGSGTGDAKTYTVADNAISSLVSVAAANVQAQSLAKANAIDLIVCVVPFSATLTGPSDTEATGVTFTSDGAADEVEFAKITNPPNTDGKRMEFTEAGVVVGVLDFPASYLGTTVRHKRVSTGNITIHTYLDGTVAL